MRIIGTDKVSERTFCLIVDEGGHRHRLVLCVDPEHPSLHLERVPKREDWRGGFGQRLRGGYLVDLRPSPDDRHATLDISFQTIEPKFRLEVSWAGRSGNLWLVDIASGNVLEKLRPSGAEVGEPFASLPPDRRPDPLSATAEHLVDSWRDDPMRSWPKRTARALRGVTRLQALAAVEAAIRDLGNGQNEAAGVPGKTAALEAGELPSVAERVLIELRRARPWDPRVYEFTEGTIQVGQTRATASDWGLPRLEVSPHHVALFEPWEIHRPDEHDSNSDAGSVPDRPLTRDEGDRLLYLLSKTHRALERDATSREQQARLRTYLQSIRKRLEGIERRLHVELSDDEGPVLRKYGQAILNNLHLLQKGAKELVCPDLEAEEPTELRIPLDPSKPATEAADAYFRRARRSEKGRPLREQRLAHVERALAFLDTASTDWSETLPGSQGEFVDALRDGLGPFFKGAPEIFGATPAQNTKSSGADSSSGRRKRKSRDGAAANGARGPGARGNKAGSPTDRPGDQGDGRGGGGGGHSSSERSRFAQGKYRPRIYETSDGWTVVAGRTNDENDYVTLKVAKQDDYWFHAHGVPGSHVVLKRDGRKDNPSKKTIEEAAAIAAFYSKARNSSRVSVIYTLKKYVTKPRKAKAGLVTCTREKSVMVRPHNPEPDAPPEWNS